MEKFFEVHDKSLIQGVFALEDREGQVQLVASSLDLISEVRAAVERYGLGVAEHHIRVQSFDGAKVAPGQMHAYEQELIR